MSTGSKYWNSQTHENWVVRPLVAMKLSRFHGSYVKGPNFVSYEQWPHIFVYTLVVTAVCIAGCGG